LYGRDAGSNHRYQEGAAVTFSIAAADPETGKVGTAVASVFPSVGAVCPWVSEHGAVLSQAWDSGPSYGKPALAMLADDIAIDDVAEVLVENRPGGAGTQFHGVTVDGATTGYTGRKATDWAGDREGENHTVAGNTLVGEEVPLAMSEAFRETSGRLSERLLSALEAGERAGGDKRGDNLSAALLLHAPEPKLYHNVRVDQPGDPIAGLRDAYETGREYYESTGDDDAVAEVWGDDYDPAIADFNVRY
jgi:uncharacterized Ntn-hydrolase superfamily protein